MKFLRKHIRHFTKKANHKGFTFVEILAVFAIMAILTSLSVAGFNAFNQSRTFENAVSDVATMVSQARSRSLSQVKKCPAGQVLNGYLVVIQITPPRQNYELDYVCNGIATALDQRTLPKNITFAPGSLCNLLFTVLTGTAKPTGKIGLIDASGQQKYLQLSSTGILTVKTGAAGVSQCIPLAGLISGSPPPLAYGIVEKGANK